MATAEEDGNSKSDAHIRETLQETALDEGYPPFFPDEKSYDDWEGEFLRYLSFDMDPSDDRDWFIRAGFRESTLDTFIARTDGDTASIELDISPEDFRGASTDDPNELGRIFALVRSDLWWAEQECKELEKKTVLSPLWTSMLLLLILILLIPFLFTDWVAPELWCYVPSPIIVMIAIVFYFLLRASRPQKSLYEEKRARVRELKAELEFVQNKIKNVEDAHR